MIGCLSVEYRGGREACLAIMEVVGSSGLSVHGLRAVPTAGSESVMLNLDLGCAVRSRLAALSSELHEVSSVIQVIHLANHAH